MKKYLTLILVLIFLSMINGCKDRDIEKVKNGRLENYSQKTIGEAIDGKLNNISWEAYNKDGKTFVKVTGLTVSYTNRVKISLIYKIDKKNEKFDIYSFQIDNRSQSKKEYQKFLKNLYEK